MTDRIRLKSVRWIPGLVWKAKVSVIIEQKMLLSSWVPSSRVSDFRLNRFFTLTIGWMRTSSH